VEFDGLEGRSAGGARARDRAQFLVSARVLAEKSEDSGFGFDTEEGTEGGSAVKDGSAAREKWWEGLVGGLNGREICGAWRRESLELVRCVTWCGAGAFNFFPL